MKAVAYDPSDGTIRICKLKRVGDKASMTEAHEDVTQLCVRAVVALILEKGGIPMTLNGKAMALGLIEEEE